MQSFQFAPGDTSQSVDLFLPDSSSTTGAGLSGLVFNTASLIAYYRNTATGTVTAITLATQTVGGAWSSGGFVELDATHAKGMYRLDLPDAVLASAGNGFVYLSGATNLAPVPVQIVVGYPKTDLRRAGGQAQTLDANNVLNVSTKYVGGTLQTARDLGLALPAAAPAAAGGLLISAAGIAGATLDAELGRLDAAVSSRMATFTLPANFASLGITAGGHVSNVDTLTTYTGNTPQTGDCYNRLGAPAGASVSADIAAVNAKTTNLPASPAAVGSLMGLADGAITDAKITFPGEAAGRPTTFLAAMRRVWEWVANKRTRDRNTGTVLLRNAADAGTLETQTQSTAGTVDSVTQGA